MIIVLLHELEILVRHLKRLVLVGGVVLVSVLIHLIQMLNLLASVEIVTVGFHLLLLKLLEGLGEAATREFYVGEGGLDCLLENYGVLTHFLFVG